MERLTERWCAGGIRIKGCSTLYPDKERKGAPASNAIVRLAAYEDTGLNPETVSDLLDRFNALYHEFDDLDLIDRVHFQAFLERVRRWNQAEKDGRLVVLPYKVGEEVWFYNRGAFDGEICPATVISIELNHHTPANPIWIRIEYRSERIGKQEYHSRWDLMNGKTVFLTREEAEAALKKREEKAKRRWSLS